MKQPQVGDVLRCAAFAFGCYDSARDRVFIIGEPQDHRVQEFIPEDERVAIAAMIGKTPPKTRVLDYGADDPTRAAARFVVTDARMAGGGKAHNDVIPDGWRVRAQRLRADGSYDPLAEEIEFYTTPQPMSHYVDHATIERLERRTKHVVFT